MNGTRTCYRCRNLKPDDQFIQRLDDRHYRMTTSASCRT